MRDTDRLAPIQDIKTRHVFALFSEGGIALELASGTYVSLNATAAAVCRLILEGKSWQDVVLAVRERWQLSNQEAQATVTQVTGSLAACRHAPGIGDSLSYGKYGDGYALRHWGSPILAVERDGNHVRLLRAPRDLPFTVAHCLRVVSPKILAAAGHIVLHTASCRPRDHLVAFCGASGAGKSTVSGILDSLGVPKLTDELLPVTVSGELAYGHPDSEGQIFQWCASNAETLEAQPDVPLSCAGLHAAANGTPVPLSKLVFLDARARDAKSFQITPLSAPDALKDILVARFLGANEQATVRAFFEGCRELAALVPCERARVPDGLPALAEALAVYSSKLTS